MTPVPDLFAGLCDDAAMFPPGNLPLPEAVAAHLVHEGETYGEIVGPFVVAAKDLDALATEVATMPPKVLRVSVTTPLPGLHAAVSAALHASALALEGVEVALPAEYAANDAVSALDDVLAGRRSIGYVEIPRNERRDDVITALAGTPYHAKIRTGGMTADLYPSSDELAYTVNALVRAGVPFKATAGLHHAIRNTDPTSGFDQHGFLNLLVATAHTMQGSSVEGIAAVLEDRDERGVVDQVERLDPSVRDAFLSFGTCSIAEPVDELVDLGLLPADHRTTR